MDYKKQTDYYYPYVLCRVGTLPFDILKSIRWDNINDLTKLLGRYHQLQKDISSTDFKASEKATIRKKIKRLEAEFEQGFSNQRHLHRTAYFALSGNLMLQRGLLQSSSSLWEGIERYRLQPTSIYRKKERQTERSIAQYLARICTKTSPFSTFTGLSLTDLSGKNVYSSKGSDFGKIRINNYVLAQLEELLAGYPDFYRNLRVQINPSLSSVGEELVFLTNSRNIESIQRMEINEVLILMLDVIRKAPNAQLRFSDLVEQLTAEVEASSEQLEIYLTQLIRYGLLNWIWPVSTTNPNWLNDFLKWLEKGDDFKSKEQLSASLQKLQTTAEELPKLSVKERKLRTQQSIVDLKDCFEKISNLIPSENEENRKEAFLAFQGKELSLNTQNLFFEDFQVHGNYEWAEADLKSAIEEMSGLIDLALPLRLYPEKEIPLDFYKTNYEGEESVSFLKFYEDFYHSFQQAGSSFERELFPNKERIISYRKQLTEELRTHIEINYDFNVHLPIQLLDTVFAQLPITKKAAAPPKTDSYGALLQLQKSKTGRYKSYVDAVFTGYGKMLGRFLHLFPAKNTTHILERIAQIRGDNLWADLADASFHNANAHPPFLNKIIAAPGTQQNHSDEITQLSLQDLSVSYDDSADGLLLFHKGEEVTVFNFGLEALQTRSPLYRLLSIFCTTQPDLAPLKNILRQATRIVKNDWVIYPRVEIGDYLIVQRKTWYVPVKDLPLREKSETEAQYFLKINVWRIQHQLPISVFICIASPELETSSKKSNKSLTDDYKPQYIDFTTPMLVSHLGRELRKVKSYLRIEEFLPGEGEMVKMEERERAVEIVVQFSTKT